jgi:hypothetical protein
VAPTAASCPGRCSSTAKRTGGFTSPARSSGTAGVARVIVAGCMRGIAAAASSRSSIAPCALRPKSGPADSWVPTDAGQRPSSSRASAAFPVDEA